MGAAVALVVMVDGDDLFDNLVTARRQYRNLLGIQDIADGHKTISMKKCNRALNITGLKYLKSLYAIVSYQMLAQLNNPWIVFWRAKPAGVCLRVVHFTNLP